MVSRALRVSSNNAASSLRPAKGVPRSAASCQLRANQYRPAPAILVHGQTNKVATCKVRSSLARNDQDSIPTNEFPPPHHHLPHLELLPLPRPPPHALIPSARHRPTWPSSGTSSTVCFPPRRLLRAPARSKPKGPAQLTQGTSPRVCSYRPHHQRHRDPVRRPLPRAHKPVVELVRSGLWSRPRGPERQGQADQPNYERTDADAEYVLSSSQLRPPSSLRASYERNKSGNADKIYLQFH